MEKYIFVEQLGEGTYGSVCRAINKDTRQVVAIKTMKTPFSSPEECLNLPEIKCARKLKGHAKIIRIKELIFNCSTDQTLHLVFESMDCNLNDLIQYRAYSKTPFSESEITNYIFQSLQGVSYMHLNGYIHRDLKPDNLLVSGEEIKIADFGFAREAVSGPPYTVNVGTRGYRAPELLLCSENYSSAVDIWSMGLILAQMFNVEPLISGSNGNVEMMKICSLIGSPTKETWAEGLIMAKKMNYKFPEVKNEDYGLVSRCVPRASKEAVSLIRWMLSWDPVKRPTALEALHHCFFRECGRVPPHYLRRTTSRLHPCVNDTISCT